VKKLPDISWSRFGVEVFMSKIAELWEIQVARPLLPGLTHHIKESKLGYLGDFYIAYGCSKSAFMTYIAGKSI
jgi:polyprenyl-phospho-N-acetylgalactosaminyl synthase